MGVGPLMPGTVSGRRVDLGHARVDREAAGRLVMALRVVGVEVHLGHVARSCKLSLSKWSDRDKSNYLQYHVSCDLLHTSPEPHFSSPLFPSLLLLLDSDSPESENPESWLLLGEARVLTGLLDCIRHLIFSLALKLAQTLRCPPLGLRPVTVLMLLLLLCSE